MDDAITAALHGAGLDAYTPAAVALLNAVVAVIALASAINAILPQPKAGSHWLPIRSLVAKAALAVGNAKPADLPPMMTWLQRLAAMVAQYLPPPLPSAGAAPARAEPTVGPGSVIAVRAAPPPPVAVQAPMPAPSAAPVRETPATAAVTPEAIQHPPMTARPVLPTTPHDAFAMLRATYPVTAVSGAIVATATPTAPSDKSGV